MALLSRARLSRWRNAVATGVRSLGITAIVLGLAGLDDGADFPVTVFAVDTSDSVLLSDQMLAMQQIETLAGSVSTDIPIGVVQFASRAEILALPGHLKTVPALSDSIPSNVTNLAQGLEAALALVPPDREGNLVFITDGNDNAGDIDAAINVAVARGITVSSMPVTSEVGTDVAIEALDVAAAVRSNSPTRAQITVVSDRLATARLRLWDGETLLKDSLVELRPGRQTFTAALVDLSKGFHRLRAELLEDDDPNRSNNVADAAVHVQSAGSVLIIGGPLDSLASKALSDVGMDVTNARPETVDPAALTDYDAVVLVNSPADSLGERLMRGLREYVRDGRGLVVTGGSDSFAAGAYEGTPLDDVLPVWSNPTEARVDPRIALVLVIDKSSSMSRETSDGQVKMELAIGAAVEAVEMLGEGDLIGVIAFDQNSQWVVPPRPMGSVGDLSGAIDAIRRIQIGDQTDLYRAMLTARTRLEQVDASIKHVILLTDGKSRVGDFQTLSRSMQRRDITISTIAIGEDADKELLGEVARLGNGRYYFVPTASDLPQVLTRETRLAADLAIVEREFQPRLQVPSPIFAGTLQGLVLPNLDGYVRTRAKPTAEVVLASDSNDPILVHWQFGRGRAVVWTSDLGTRWASDWQQWAPFDTYIGQLVDWAMPAPDGTLVHGLHTASNVSTGRTTLTIDSLNADRRFRNGLETSVRLIPAKGPARTFIAVQKAPGRYVLDTASPPSGVYEVEIEQRAGGVVVASSRTSLVVPARDEFRDMEPDIAWLRWMAVATGGTLIESDIDLVRAITRVPATGGIMGWPFFITAGLLLVVADIGIRRVRGTPGEIWSQLRERIELTRVALRSTRCLRFPRQLP
jgi:uncharacterized membrane protein